jgi:hypothetical protein
MTTYDEVTALETHRPFSEWPSVRYWGMHVALWVAYSASLMLPWLGEYSIALMLPNKAVIAATAILSSALLREVYLRLLPRDVSVERMLVVAFVASVGAGALWSGMMASLIGTRGTEDLLRLVRLDGGVPRLGGPAYEVLVLFIWSMAYLAIRRSREHRMPKMARSVHRTRDNLLVVADTTRSFVAEPHEIDWVEAAGDYVRVHAGRRAVLVRGTMSQYEAGLGAAFVRIHRSTIVNVGTVRELVARPNRELLVVLRDGTRLRASRSYADRLRSALAPHSEA